MNSTKKMQLTLIVVLVLTALAAFAEAYPRAGWAADMRHGAHSSEGFATIVDERTIQIDHFSYDGGAPAVYFYLGRSNTQQGFINGIPIGPQLNHAYNDETVVVQLPESQTIDGYSAISVWCADFNANFTSASFVCAADLVPDGEIGLADLAALLGNYGMMSGAELEDGDLDGDADVDLSDLAELLSVYGMLCNPTLTMDFDGIEDLGSDYVYEGWLIVDGMPVSSGRFSVNGSGNPFPGWFVVDAQDAADAVMFVLTIEPAVGDDPGPADTHFLAGVFDGDTAEITIGHPAALGDDFMSAAGGYILATPSTADIDEDYDQGIWWLDPAAGPGPSLMLPTLPAGWVYEGWVVGMDGPVSTGRFTSVSGADSDGAGPNAGMDGFPPFPGQDYITPPMSLIGYAAVISVEPEPDNSPGPFTLKPLVDGNVEDVAPPTLQAMGNNAGSVPIGVVTIE